MSTQVKRIKIATRNNSARIKSVDGGDYRATFTDGREDGFTVGIESNSGRQTLYIDNAVTGRRDSVSLTGRQIRTLRRVLDKHFYG